jgi:hypothetical protein
MNPLEILIVLFNFGSLLFLSFPQAWVHSYGRNLPFFGLLAMVLQILLTKPRWQMFPLYVLTFALFIFGVVAAITQTNPVEMAGHRALPYLIVGWVFLLLSFGLPVLVPVPKLPVPSGTFAVGTQTFYWQDADRTEIFGTSAGEGPRRLMVQVWYPAVKGETLKTVPYVDDPSAFSRGAAKMYHAPGWIANYVGLIQTHSARDAALEQSNQPFPVLIFSHGWNGYRTQNTYQMEELASHGYVVFAPDHTYGSIAVTFPGGESILVDPGILPFGAEESIFDPAARTLGSVWEGDLHFVLGQIERLNQGEIAGPFKGKLDLSRLGVLGHSTGAGAAVEFCWSEDLCKAGLAMDTWLEPYSRSMTEEGLSKPFLFMESERWNQGEDNKNEPLFDALYAHSQGEKFWLEISGTRHTDFADLPALTPLFLIPRLGNPFYGSRVLQIVNTYSLAFFDHYLKGASASLLDGPSAQFPEVSFMQK